MAISKTEKNKLDALAAKKCKEHAGHQCVRCCKRSPDPEDIDQGLQWCHVVTRSYLSTRWNLKNCLCLCAGCHMWGHKHPVEFGLWLMKEFGEEWYYKLKRPGKPKQTFDIVKKYLDESKPKDCLIPKSMRR